MTMNNQLYLLRHAKSEPWKPLGNDFSRALSQAGTRHARCLADWAHATLTMPDTVFCSPAKRTRETLSPILALWPQILSMTRYIDSMYGASTELLLTLMNDAFSYSDRLLMVGHNPGFENVLMSVVQHSQRVNISNMSTGTLAVIDFDSGFTRDSRNGDLKHMVRGKELLE